MSICDGLQPGCGSTADRLNSDCFCTTLNRDQLNKVLQADDINQDVLMANPQLFSNTTVFISAAQMQQMREIVRAVTRVVKLPEYAQHIFAREPHLAVGHSGPEGVFMGYDFHLSDHGPKIIEINTNAGGAFLNSALINAQTECCRAEGVLLPRFKNGIDDKFLAMFLREWQLQGGEKQLKTIAIVDENPQQQFLYPEFKMAQRLFESHGIAAIIADPGELKFTNDQLSYGESGQIIDLVYNRLTDFSLAEPQHSALRQAYELNAVVVTPNPRHHAFYADKRNLIVLSDSQSLINMGVEQQDSEILQQGIPRTQNVNAKNADELWSSRKHLFFKPAVGFGSRATYRGDKLTKRVWAEILQGEYVAQQLVAPSERGMLVDGVEVALKMDIRAYVYAGEIQLLAARLYQGQTTNFRTQGGGFAPVFVVE
ncbi:MAG: hypothetical protein V4660_18010 [Pseudomonadota bacterium]